VSSRCGREISQIETGIETEQAIRNLGIKAADIPGYSIYFLLIHIAGDQKGAGNQERGLGPLWDPFAQFLEIVQGLLIGNAA
jgi:hypothetical protein